MILSANVRKMFARTMCEMWIHLNKHNTVRCWPTIRKYSSLAYECVSIYYTNYIRIVCLIFLPTPKWWHANIFFSHTSHIIANKLTYCAFFFHNCSFECLNNLVVGRLVLAIVWDLTVANAVYAVYTPSKNRRIQPKWSGYFFGTKHK